MKRTITILFYLLGTVTISNAQTAEQKPTYFPLKRGNEWTYTSTTFEKFSNGDPQKIIPLLKTDTFYYRIADTIILDKKKYFVLVDKEKNLSRIIRFDKTTGNYYSSTLLLNKTYSTEKLFLKNNPQVNKKWIVVNNNGKINFKVTSITKDTTINGNHYKNVVQVNESLFNKKANKIITIKHWYAKNIGEVASYLPYPLGNNIGDVKLVLSNYPMAK